MLRVERYELPDEKLPTEEALKIRDAFLADEEGLKKDLDKAAELQRQSEHYVMTHY